VFFLFLLPNKAKHISGKEKWMSKHSCAWPFPVLLFPFIYSENKLLTL
jgi:hypothetical protein